MAGHTKEERASALAHLGAWADRALGPEFEDAVQDLWGHLHARALELGDAFPMAQGVEQAWFWFDRPLPDGRRVVERYLHEAPRLPAAERSYLQQMLESSMRLYDVEDLRPGLSITLRDVLEGTRVTVRERTASRALRRAELVAARVIPVGVSGRPEIDHALLPIAGLIARSVVEQVTERRATFRRENPDIPDVEFWKEMSFFFFSAWLQSMLEPVLPRMKTTDGEDLVFTKVHFEVTDMASLGSALDRAPGLERDGDGWLWSGPNARAETITLGQLHVIEGMLVLETHAVERAERGRALVETAAGGAVKYRLTAHEDLASALRNHRADGGSTPSEEELPPGVAEGLALEHQARHYRRWVDEPVPALGGRTPREAARDAALRPQVVDLVRGIEGLYEEALRSDAPAYDPWWMWEALGLRERAQPQHPPQLAHERFDEAWPGLAVLCREVADRFRAQPGFDDARTLCAPVHLEADFGVRRFLADHADARDVLSWRVSFELHRRKTFWVDESLAFMLGKTDVDVPGDEVRAPFPCFAIVFTDRFVLSLAERVMASQRSPQAGHILQVLTVYVTEAPSGVDRVLHLRFACDAAGADVPHLVEHELRLAPMLPVALPPFTPCTFTMDGQELTLPDPPLNMLLRVTLNALLYATSAGPGAEERHSPRLPGKRPSRDQAVVSSDSVFFLPGTIDISRLRKLQDLGRAPSGGQMLHRFMVRGHWRRPAKNWHEQRARWIAPYWKGPDLASVIERTYKLKP